MVVQEDLTHDLVSSSLKCDKKHRLKQRFDVQRKLGQGTYGKVQLAVNRETGQEVAVKTIKKIKIENEQDLIRIRREIQIMSSIQHPHIIHIYEVFENKDKIVLVMQFASGGELYDYLSEKKVLSDSEARRIFRQIAAAVYYCHKNKICHRDLKLENILLDEKGNAKIADFGLSNVFDEKHMLDTYCGSPLYASPEIVKGVPYYGPEVDCWSMGVLLYTLVYGAMPFDGSNFKKLVTQISEGDYFEPKKKSSASELIRKLLTVNSTKRATIVDICMDYWVNYGYEHSLLQVAEDMANLTPVRLDLLLALAPSSNIPEESCDLDNKTAWLNETPEKYVPDEEEEEEEEEYNPDTAANSFSFMKGSHASHLSVSQPNLQEALEDEYEEDDNSEFLPANIAVALQEECAKRLAENSFGSSISKISSFAHCHKKPKKSDSINKSVDHLKSRDSVNNLKQTKSENLSKSPSTSVDTKPDETKKQGGKAEIEQAESCKTPDSIKEQIGSIKQINKEITLQKESSEKDLKTNDESDRKDNSAVNLRKDSLSSDEKSDSKKLGRPPGKIIIPKTFDSNQSPSPKLNSFKQFPNENKIASEQKNPTEYATEIKSQEPENVIAKEDINKNIIETSEKTESPTISEEKKNIAKGILKKGIAKAKLAERRMSKQNSLEYESSACSTPTSVSTPEPKPSFFKAPKPFTREEEKSVTSKAEIKLSSPQSSTSTIKLESKEIQKAPLWDNAGQSSERKLHDRNLNWSAVSSTADSEVSGWKDQIEESIKLLSPEENASCDSYVVGKIDDDKPLVPIARSYKKFTFTKDGACITETKKIYTTPGADGSWTKVEKKTKITTRPGNAEEFEKFRDLHLRTDSPLNRSDSQSSSGSNDVYDDIFDSWTSDKMKCNMQKMNRMFQKFSRDPFLRRERRQNPFRYFRRTESERSNRSQLRHELHGQRSAEQDLSENEECDMHFDDSKSLVYGSQGLWQLLRSTSKGFPEKVSLYNEPSYGRSVSQDRSESKFDNWRSTSRGSSGYNTNTRSQSRDRTESPRDKVLRFVLESSKDGFPTEAAGRHEKWFKKRMPHHSRRDSGVGSDGYESEYSVRQCPSDELSRMAKLPSVSSICSSTKQDMIRNFMKSWSREFMSPPASPTDKEQVENLSENRKHRVEQWLHMNSESPFCDNYAGMGSRKSSVGHNSASAYATMNPREYLRYNRSSSDKISDSYYPCDGSARIRSHSLNKDSASGEINKMHFKTGAYSPVSEGGSTKDSSHHSDSSHSGSSVHRINFTISDGKANPSHIYPSSKISRQFSSNDSSIRVESPLYTDVKFESAQSPGQPIVQMRVSFNRNNRDNQVIHVTSQSSPQASKGLWEQQDLDKFDSNRTRKQEFPPVTRNKSPLPGIRQFSTEVQHSVGSSDGISDSANYESPQNTESGKKVFYKTVCLPNENGIWDLACSQNCMKNNSEFVNMNLSAEQVKANDNIGYNISNFQGNTLELSSLKHEFLKKSESSECQSISNGANTPDSLEDLSLEKSLSECAADFPIDEVSPQTLESNRLERSEFHLEVKPLGALWNTSDSQNTAKFREKDKCSPIAQNISPVSCISSLSEVPVVQKCLDNASEIGSIWNQKNSNTFDLLRNLLSDDGLDSFTSSKCVLTSDVRHDHEKKCAQDPIGYGIDPEVNMPVIDDDDKFRKMMPSLMDDLQSPKEVLRQAMRICESFEK